MVVQGHGTPPSLLSFSKITLDFCDKVTKKMSISPKYNSTYYLIPLVSSIVLSPQIPPARPLLPSLHLDSPRFPFRPSGALVKKAKKQPVRISSSYVTGLERRYSGR